MTRDERKALARKIASALHERSGKRWSVSMHGEITTPPARRMVDGARTAGHEELRDLLGLSPAFPMPHWRPVSFFMEEDGDEFLARAEGRLRGPGAWEAREERKRLDRMRRDALSALHYWREMEDPAFREDYWRTISPGTAPRAAGVRVSILGGVPREELEARHAARMDAWRAGGREACAARILTGLAGDSYQGEELVLVYEMLGGREVAP